MLVDGKVFLGTTDGEVVVLRHGKDLEVLAVNQMQGRLHTTPVVANGTLYIAAANRLVAIEQAKR